MRIRSPKKAINTLFGVINMPQVASEYRVMITNIVDEGDSFSCDIQAEQDVLDAIANDNNYELLE